MVGKSTNKPLQSARNVGVVFNKQVFMANQVTNICKFANYSLCNIGAIQEVFTDASAKQLIHSLISAKLNYCNSLPDVQLKRLLYFQNNTAQIVSKVTIFEPHTASVEATLLALCQSS